MSTPTKLWSLTATEVLSLIRQDQLTVEDYAHALLDRIQSRDSVVKAWQYLDTAFVLAQARALDRVPRDQRGQLHGVAIGIKDNIDTKDMPTEYGSPLRKGNRPNTDASAVEILRRTGALILGMFADIAAKVVLNDVVGKTTTTEFAAVNSGPHTTNPHDPSRTPGGSSTGSAAAVADFQVPLSCGTQTGGSVIRPASYTGTYAMKPTLNTISRQGIKIVSHELDTFGYFARSIEDLKLITDVFNVTANQPIKEIPLKSAKVGFVKTPFWPLAGPGTVAAMEKATNILRNHGVMVEEVEFPNGFDDATALKRMLNVILTIDAHASFLNEYQADTTKTRLNPKIRAYVEEASRISREEVRRAFDCCAAMRPVFDQIAAKYSALIAPSAADEAPLGLGAMGDNEFNAVWTVRNTILSFYYDELTYPVKAAYMPVIHVPALAGHNGMPVGLSLITRRFCDQHLLSIAKVLSGPLMSEGSWRKNMVGNQG
ncbi:MAG: hypothetical protein M1820_006277 [Bogoriella megaspora]|nr:MAG: hypothetical protein M1820_006277 [Bogoriella megaspora]